MNKSTRQQTHQFSLVVLFRFDSCADLWNKNHFPWCIFSPQIMVEIRGWSTVPYLFLRFPPCVHENNSSPLSASPFSLQPVSWWIAVSWRWSVPSAACQQAAFRRSQTPCTSPTSSSSAPLPGHLAPPARWPAACPEQMTTPWWSARPSTLTRSSCRWCPSTAGRSSSSSMTQILVRISIGVENSRYSAYQTLQPDFCQRLPRYSWSSVRIHQNLHSVSGYLYKMKQSDYIIFVSTRTASFILPSFSPWLSSACFHALLILH